MAWVCAGAAVLALVLLVLAGRSPHYKRIFGDEHLLEFAGAVAGLKPLILADIEDAGAPRMPDPNDPRQVRSSAGIVMFYTITRRGERYEHHYSLRDAQGYTARAVGRTFVAATAVVLGVDTALLRVECSENTVFHAEFSLDEAQQHAFAERLPRVPASGEVGAFRGEVTRIGNALTVEGVETGIKFQRGRGHV